MNKTFKDWMIENSWCHKGLAVVMGMFIGNIYKAEMDGVLAALHMPPATEVWGMVGQNVLLILFGGSSIWLTKIKAHRHAADPKPKEPGK